MGSPQTALPADYQHKINPAKTLYVTDLDGTLLRNDHTLNPQARERLNRLLAEGLQFTVATARSPISCNLALHGLELRLPFIAGNGAFISDVAGKHQYLGKLNDPLARGLLGHLQEREALPFVSTHLDQRDQLVYTDLITPGMRWYADDRIRHRDPRLVRHDDFEHAMTGQVTCLTWIHAERQIKDLAAEIREEYREIRTTIMENLYVRGQWWLTLVHPESTKSSGLTNLTRLIQSEQEYEHIVAFGDQAHDIDLLEAADFGLAVSNADPDVLHAADFVIGANEQDAVVDFLELEWARLHQDF